MTPLTPDEQQRLEELLEARYKLYVHTLRNRNRVAQRKAGYRHAGMLDEYDDMCKELDDLLNDFFMHLSEGEIKAGLDEVPQIRTITNTTTKSTHYISLN